MRVRPTIILATAAVAFAVGAGVGESGDVGVAWGAQADSKPRAQASRGACGRKRTGRSIAVRMIVRRQGGGTDKQSNRFIRYHVHFQTKAFARPAAQFTNLTVVGRTPGGRRLLQKDGTGSKLNRPGARRDYAHTTVRVKPGSKIRFHGRTQFKSPGIPLPGNRYLTADGFRGDCDAR